MRRLPPRKASSNETSTSDSWSAPATEPQPDRCEFSKRSLKQVPHVHALTPKSAAPKGPVDEPRARRLRRDPVGAPDCALGPGRRVHAFGNMSEVVPERVIALAGLRIGQDVVGLRDLGESTLPPLGPC